MKSAIIDWITPKGQSLTPHIPRNVKAGRGFNHEHTGTLLCLAGLDWENTEYVTTEFPSRWSLTNPTQNEVETHKRPNPNCWRPVADILVCELCI